MTMCTRCGWLEHQRDEAQAEVVRLKDALGHIAVTCVADPDTAQFAARFADGSAELTSEVERLRNLKDLVFAALTDESDGAVYRAIQLAGYGDEFRAMMRGGKPRWPG
jgi:hypothetical protein